MFDTRKSRMIDLTSGEESMTIFIEYRNAMDRRKDGRTDGQTDRQTDRIAISISILRVSMLTRDKKTATYKHYLPDEYKLHQYSISRY